MKGPYSTVWLVVDKEVSLYPQGAGAPLDPPSVRDGTTQRVQAVDSAARVDSNLRLAPKQPIAQCGALCVAPFHGMFGVSLANPRRLVTRHVWCILGKVA